MYVGPLGALVADVSANVAHTFFLLGNDVSQNVFFRDNVAVWLVRAQLAKQIIESFVA